MQEFEEYKWTTNRSVYNKLRKHYFSINNSRCPLCPYHLGENTDPNRPVKSWKFKRKVKKQWMGGKKVKKREAVWFRHF